MKVYRYKFNKEWRDKYLGKKIRKKIDIIARLLQICRFLLSADECGHNEEAAIIINKNSRVFIFDENDYFYSFMFPFTIKNMQQGSSDKHLFLNSMDIPSGMIRYLLERIERGESVFCNSGIDDLDDIYDFELSAEKIQEVVLFLLQFEAGYVRYEKDVERENKNHPLFHLDWNYDEIGQVKTGLKTPINRETFQEIILLERPCWFLEKPNA